MIETTTIIQAIYFILKNSRSKVLDKIKIIKLLYLADKYHLLLYGRTITNDSYFAMENGPVGSTSLNVLSFNDISLSGDEYKYAKKLLGERDKHSFYAKDCSSNLDMLSETDKEAIAFVLKYFGNMKTWDLVKFTHNYPEWKKHSELFKEKKIKREPIDSEELLSTIPGDRFNISKEHIKESRTILRERRCL